MKNLHWRQLIKHVTPWRIAILLSSASVAFGLIREILIVGILGFSSANDRLQLYLSIFYTIGLSIDAIRLTCLNLYPVLSLWRLLISASIIGLPFALVISLVMSYTIGDLDIVLLSICIFGSYLNLMAALMITWLQRNDMFLAAQIINIFPNFILIPGILICYWMLGTNMISSIICLITLIPVAQCIILLALAKNRVHHISHPISLGKSIVTFARHFTAMTGEQCFQIIARTAFYNGGTGYLSVYAITVRIYSAIRFILIDSFIGSRLANWHKEGAPNNHHFVKLINSTLIPLAVASLALLISMQYAGSLKLTSLKIILIMVSGFYFSTLVRVIYFKINRYKNNAMLVTQFASFELLCAFCAFILTRQAHYPLLSLLWIGYIAKPLAQIFLLRQSYHNLTSATEPGVTNP